MLCRNISFCASEISGDWWTGATSRRNQTELGGQQRGSEAFHSQRKRRSGFWAQRINFLLAPNLTGFRGESGILRRSFCFKGTVLHSWNDIAWKGSMLLTLALPGFPVGRFSVVLWIVFISVRVCWIFSFYVFTFFSAPASSQSGNTTVRLIGLFKSLPVVSVCRVVCLCPFYLVYFWTLIKCLIYLFDVTLFKLCWCLHLVQIQLIWYSPNQAMIVVDFYIFRQFQSQKRSGGFTLTLFYEPLKWRMHRSAVFWPINVWPRRLQFLANFAFFFVLFFWLKSC